MRKLKKILCLFLIFPLILLVSCADPNDENPDNGDGSGSGNEEEIEETLSISEILAFAFDCFDADSKKEIESKNSLSTKSGNEYVYFQYDEFIFASMKMLDAISEVENLQEDVWCYDDAVDMVGNNKANKVSRFLVSSSEIGDVTKITIYLQMEILGMSFADYSKTYNLYCYEINYYSKINKVSIDIQVDKSRNYIAVEEKGSYATYYLISFSNGVMVANTFKRLIDIDLSSTDAIVPSTITEYSSLRFDFNTNTALETVGFSAGTNYADLQEYFLEELTAFNDNYDYVNGSQVVQTKVEGLTSAVVDIANAGVVADINN